MTALPGRPRWVQVGGRRPGVGGGGFPWGAERVGSATSGWQLGHRQLPRAPAPHSIDIGGDHLPTMAVEQHCPRGPSAAAGTPVSARSTSAAPGWQPLHWTMQPRACGLAGGAGGRGADRRHCGSMPGAPCWPLPCPHCGRCVCVCVSVSACVGVCAHVRSCVCTYMQVCEVCARVSMCVQMSAHMHAHGCMYTCVHACDACLYVHVRARVHPCLHMFECAEHVCARARMLICVHVCVHACVCMIARAFLCACVCVHCVHVCAHACGCMRTCACTRAFVHTCVHVCVSLRLDAEKATGPARAQEGSGGGSRGHGWPRGPGSSQVMAITPAAYPNRPRRCTKEVTSTLFPR